MIKPKGVNLAELLHCGCVYHHVYSCTRDFSMANMLSLLPKCMKSSDKIVLLAVFNEGKIDMFL